MMEWRYGNRRYKPNWGSSQWRAMATDLKASAQRVQDALAALGFTNRAMELPVLTRTVVDS